MRGNSAGALRYLATVRSLLYDRGGGPLTDAALNSTKALLRLAELEVLAGAVGSARRQR